MHKRSILNKGIVALVGMVLLIGVLETPSPRVASAGPTIGEGICAVFTLGVCIAFWSHPFGTTPTETPIATTCTNPRLTGSPQFLSMPKGTAKYPFDGICTSPERPGAQIKYRWEGSWSPSETNPNKPNASETIEVTGYEPFMPDREPGGRIFMYWTARCNRDPWLAPEGASCQRLGAFIPDDLREVAPDLHAAIFPKTRDLISANDRQRFYAQYLHLNAPAATKLTPGVAAPVITPDMFTITRPSYGDRVVQGQLMVAAQQPKIGSTPVTELEFRWLDAPKNQPYVNTFAVDTPKLLQGYPVAQAVTRGNVGRWEVRARASGKAVPGPWSLPVQFQLFLTQPTQSQQPPSPVQQIAPLPSSTVVQPSPVPQTAPPSSSSVMQAPSSSGSTTTQMRRSSSMVMPRGVDEKGGMEGTETLHAPAEGIQKP